MHALKIVLALCCLLPASSFAAEDDYCNMKICRGNEHIACDAFMHFKSTCPPDGHPEQLDLSTDQKDMIVQVHNRYRSQVAIGNVSGYEPAANMLEMNWDNDLAYVAGFNARGCVMQHDACRSTSRYPYSGQNLAYTARTGSYIEDNPIIVQMIGYWFDEYPNTNMDIIRKFKSVGGPMYGHFTAMMHELNDHVGCAVVRYRNGQWYSTYLVCNYAYTNVLDHRIYLPGQSCSQCKNRCSDVYPGLCVS